MSKVPLKVTLKCECPCGAAVRLVEGPTGDPGVMHSLPTCETFARLDVMSYLQWLRRRAQGIMDA